MKILNTLIICIILSACGKHNLNNINNLNNNSTISLISKKDINVSNNKIMQIKLYKKDGICILEMLDPYPNNIVITHLLSFKNDILLTASTIEPINSNFQLKKTITHDISAPFTTHHFNLMKSYFSESELTKCT